MNIFKEKLNTEQCRVVSSADGRSLVLAGAGSGKTRTIAYRVAHLVQSGVSASEILLLTFTNKAAKEMNSRITMLLGDKVHLPWSGTFHSIACKILRRYAQVIGYSNSFTILDSGDSVDLVKLCIKAQGVDTKSKRFPSAKVVLSIISFGQNACIPIVDVLEKKYPQWLDFEGDIVVIAVRYHEKKRLSGVMDFDDLLVYFYRLLHDFPEVRTELSKQFRYVIVDEYQDTNTIQAGILRLCSLFHKNLLVVGDDAQSIYSFRAADIANILDFEKMYPGAEVFRLEVNYRSTPNILDVANCVLAQNKTQYEKTLRSVQDSAGSPEVHVFADAKEEAEFVAYQIQDLLREGVKPNSIAVLFRAAFHSQALEMVLLRLGISYEYRGGVRFFDRAHIKDVLAFLRILHNPRDEMAWTRVLLMQTGIGPVTIQKILHHIFSFGDGITSASLESVSSILSAKARIGWGDFMMIYNALTVSSDLSPQQLIGQLLDSKFAEYLESEYVDYRDRLQDVDHLAVFSAEHDDLAVFLSELVLHEQFVQKTQKNKNTVLPEDKVILSTVHQAKGLEWETVFVIHMSDGQFPNERATFEIKGLEEERRLFYVAITRAKKQLFFTYPVTTHRHMALGKQSVFLEELDRDLVETYGFSGSSCFVDDLSYGKSTTFFTDPSDSVDDIEYIPEDEPFGNNVPKGRRNLLSSF